MKIRALKKIEKVQLVLPPPRRPDTYITKFAGWPQSLGILSVETYIKQNNPGVEVCLGGALIFVPAKKGGKTDG